MKTISNIRYAVLLLLVSLTSCVRNELPEKRSTSKTRVDHLLIKEVFYAGHYWVRDLRKWGFPNSPDMYNDDQYIEIYNPTDETKYLDGLALCTNAIDPTTIIQFAPKDDFINRYYGVSAISFFPGNGTQYPVQPHKSVIIAKYAIDHEKQFIAWLRANAEENGEELDLKEYKGLEAFLDLTKADFEWTMPTGGRNDKNNPDVPDMQPIYMTKKADGKLAWQFELTFLSEHTGLALIRLPWTPDDFKKNLSDSKDHKGYRHYITVTSSQFADFYVIEVPFDHVIDCMTICPRTRFQMRPSKLDKGYNAVTDVGFSSLKSSDLPIYSGLALTRKWDGRKFVDDDNSKSDFEVKVAALSRRDKKGNPIK